MNQDQKRKLESFLKRTEGEPPLVFVGRSEVLDDLALAAEQVWEGSGTDQHGAGKATRIIQGAPGAGKSSILEEIKKNPERLYTESVGKPPLVVVLESGVIEEPVDILQPLARSINPTAAEEFLSHSSRTSGGEAGIGLGPVKAVGKQETTMEPARPRIRWDVLGDWVEQHGGFDRPIVLAIDEAQNLDHDRTHPLSKLLQALHGNCGLPIALVLAGLSDTEYSARKMGLTRMPHRQKHSIGRFPDHEVQELMERSCAHFGIDTTGFGHEIDRLIQPCDGWPRHLHIVLQALGAEALRTEGDLGRAAWERIQAEIKTGRDGYYDGQFSDEMEISRNMTAQVMTELDYCSDRAAIQNLMDKLHDSDPREYRLPAGMDADSFFIHLVHQGALHRESRNQFVCPIPSFRTYLLEHGGIAENSNLQPQAT